MALIETCGAKVMHYFRRLHSIFQSVAERSQFPLVKLIALLLCRPCFEISNLAFKATYALQKRKLLRVKQKPSFTYQGEPSTDVLHHAAGEATSRWEHMESALIKLFQLMCETPKLNACRAYSTIISSTSWSGAIRAAASVFFATRDETDFAPVDLLLKAYATAAGYRNNIAHGIASGCFEGVTHLGYYIQSPSYGPKFEEILYQDGRWWLGSKYFYRKDEISSCTARFEEILNETMRIVMDINQKYSVLELGNFIPSRPCDLARTTRLFFDHPSNFAQHLTCGRASRLVLRVRNRKKVIRASVCQVHNYPERG